MSQLIPVESDGIKHLTSFKIISTLTDSNGFWKNPPRFSKISEFDTFLSGKLLANFSHPQPFLYFLKCLGRDTQQWNFSFKTMLMCKVKIFYSTFMNVSFTASLAVLCQNSLEDNEWYLYVVWPVQSLNTRLYFFSVMRIEWDGRRFLSFFPIN